MLSLAPSFRFPSCYCKLSWTSMNSLSGEIDQPGLERVTGTEGLEVEHPTTHTAPREHYVSPEPGNEKVAGLRGNALDRRHLPWGLSLIAYTILTAAITAILVGAAVGGGVAGGLANKLGTDCSTRENVMTDAHRDLLKQSRCHLCQPQTLRTIPFSRLHPLTPCHTTVQTLTQSL